MASAIEALPGAAAKIMEPAASEKQDQSSHRHRRPSLTNLLVRPASPGRVEMDAAAMKATGPSPPPIVSKEGRRPSITNLVVRPLSPGRAEMDAVAMEAARPILPPIVSKEVRRPSITKLVIRQASPQRVAMDTVAMGEVGMVKSPTTKSLSQELAVHGDRSYTHRLADMGRMLSPFASCNRQAVMG